MIDLGTLRAAARDNLRAITGDAAPTWRQVFSDNTEAPSAIGPVCTDPDHEPDDGSAYGCCPDPIIETLSQPLAAYLVALLNADGSR